jgi:hypothetical protein
MGTDSQRDLEIKNDEVYSEDELGPGGSGKQGDQQQMGQDREPRKDKHNNEGGSDKEHVDERAAEGEQ